MFKKLLLIITSTILLSSIGFSQFNSVYAEGGGAGLLFSLNYERMLTDNISVRVGYGSASAEEEGHEGHSHGDEGDGKITFIPIGANYLIGSGNNKLTIGGGMTMVNTTMEYELGSLSLDANFPYATAGYRYQRGTGGLYMSFSGYAFFIKDLITEETTMLPWGGLSFGWTF